MTPDAVSPSDLRRHARLLDRVQVARLGLGWFFSIKGALAVMVGAVLIVGWVDDARFAAKREPTSVRVPPDLDRLTRNDFVRLTATLDHSRRIVVEPARREAFTLTPIAATSHRLIVHQQGVPTAGEAAGEPGVFLGRLVARDWSGKWDLRGASMDIVALFHRQRIDVPAFALVLVDGERPALSLWLTFVAGVSVLILLWFVVRVRRTLEFLSDRDRLAEHLRGHAL